MNSSISDQHNESCKFPHLPTLEPPNIVATPELVFKMSKKIAQLTKVIFFVNLKNDLHQSETDALIQKYEEELKQKDSEHQVTVSELNSKIESLKQENELKISDIEKDFKREILEKTAKGFEIENDWKSKLDKAMSDYQRDILRETLKAETFEKLLKETQTAKNNKDIEFDSKCKEYASLKNEFESASKAWAGEKYLLQQKLEAIESLNHERYLSLNASHQQEIDTLKLRHSTELQEKIRSLESAHFEKVKDVTLDSETLRSEIKKLLSEKEVILHENEVLQSEIAFQAQEKEKLLSESKAERSKLETRIQKVEDELQTVQYQSELHKKEKTIFFEESKERIKNLQDQLISQKKSFQEEARQTLDATIYKFEAKLEELRQRNDSLVLQFKSDKEAFEREILNKQTELKIISSKLLNLERDSNASIKEKEAELELFKSEMVEKEIQLLNRHTTELKSAELGFSQQLGKLISEKEELVKKLDETTKEKEKIFLHKTNLDALQSSFNHEKTCWEQEKKELLRSQREQDSFFVEKRKEHELKIQSLEENLTSMRVSEEKIKVDLKASLNKLSCAEALLNEKIKVEVQHLDLISKLELEIQTLKDLQLQLKTQNATETASSQKLLTDLTSEKEELQSKLKYVTLESDSLRNQLDTSLLELKTKSEETLNIKLKLEDITKEYERLKEDLRAKLDFVTKQLIISENREVELKLIYDAALKESSEENDKKIKQLNSRILDLERTLAIEKQSFVDQFASFRKEKEKEMHNKSEKLEKEKENLFLDYQRELNSLKTLTEELSSSLQNEMEKCKEKQVLLIEQERNVSQLRADHEIQLNSIQEKYKTDTNTLKQLQMQLIEKIKKENLSTIEKMLSEFEEAQAFMKNELEKQTEKLNDAEIRYKNREAREVDLARIRDLEGEIERLNRKNCQIMEELNKSRREIQYREDSLNRLFKTKPNVGVINPLSKKGSSLNSLNSSSSSLRTAPGPLPPLSNSPKGSEETLGTKSRGSSASSLRKTGQ